MKLDFKSFNVSRYILLILLIQPIIDIYRCFFQGKFSFFGFAIEEFINLALIGILGVLILVHLIKTKDIKRGILLGIYAGLCGIYLVLHMWNSAKFDVNVFTLATPSMIHNAYYIVRVYGLPMILLVGILIFRVKKDDFIKTCQILALFITSIMLISNLTETSLVSYSLGIDKIEGGFFRWNELNSDSNFEAWTSKGFFYSANQMSAYLFALMPVTTYAYITKFNWKSLLVVLIQMSAMIMIGTKTAAQGALIGFAFLTLVSVCVLIYRVIVVDKKSLKVYIKENKAKLVYLPLALCITLAGFGMYQKSPGKLRIDYLSYLNGPGQREEKENDLEMSDEEWIRYIDEYYWFFYINREYIDVYPIEDNLNFWISMVKRDRTLNRDNRNFKVQMNHDILMKNDGPIDSLVGVGYTSNLLYTERDYYYQYSIMGIMGMILFMLPYFLVVLYAGFKILLNMKKHVVMINMALGLSLCLYFLIAYMAGHTFGIVINMLMMAAYTGMLFNSVKE